MTRPGGTVIRKAREDEREALVELRASFVAELGAAADGGEVLVAAQDGRLAGFAAFAGDELIALYVRPDARRRGLGADLLAHAEAEIADEGRTLSRVRVPQAQTGAQRFLERNGWRHAGAGEGQARLQKRLQPRPGRIRCG
jgi:GNAT superfamily N-acetyltransferase